MVRAITRARETDISIEIPKAKAIDPITIPGKIPVQIPTSIVKISKAPNNDLSGR